MGKIIYAKTPLYPDDLQKPEERLIIGTEINIAGKTFKIEFQPVLNHFKESHFYIMDGEKIIYLFEYDALIAFNAIGYHTPLQDGVLWVFDLNGEKFVIEKATASTFKVTSTETTDKYDYPLNSGVKRLVKDKVQKIKREVPDYTLELLQFPWRYRITDERGQPCEPIRWPQETINKIETQRNKKIRKAADEERKRAEKRAKDTAKRLQKLRALKIS